MENPWQNPPEEMFTLIYVRLWPIDRLSFSGVCSSWRRYAATLRGRTFPLILPRLHWLGSCRLRSPFNDNVYLPYQHPHAEDPQADFVRCRGSVGSWLLYHTFKAGKRPFFLDPTFNDRRVDLPPWYRPGWLLYDAIISDEPTEEGCTVVFLDQKTIVHCKARESRWWDSFEVDTDLSRSTGAFLRGTLYLIDEHQRLGVVDLRKVPNAVTWLPMDVGPLRERTAVPIEYGRQFLMESSGTLLLAFVGQPRRWFVFRADLTQMVWRGVVDLQHHSLLLSPSRSVSAVAKKVRVAANRLYFVRGENCESGLGRWISVSTHGQDNCWEESLERHYGSRIISPLQAPRWVFQPAVYTDGVRLARRTGLDSSSCFGFLPPP